MSLYFLFKSMHLLGVVLFLGNIIVTGWWKYMADRNGDPLVIAFAQRQVTLTDYVFTAGGAALVFVGGVAMSVMAGLQTQFWVLLGAGLFTLSGIIWAVILIPVQIKQARMAKAFKRNEPIPRDDLKLNQPLRDGIQAFIALINIWNILLSKEHKVDIPNIVTFIVVATLLVISPGPNGFLIAKTVPISGKKQAL